MDARTARAAVAGIALCIAGLPLARAADAPAAGHRTALVDINSADLSELRRLPGIGPGRAKAIVAGRPYADKDDLVKRNIIPKNVFEGIRNRIVAKRQ